MGGCRGRPLRVHTYANSTKNLDQKWVQTDKKMDIRLFESARGPVLFVGWTQTNANERNG